MIDYYDSCYLDDMKTTRMGRSKVYAVKKRKPSMFLSFLLERVGHDVGGIVALVGGVGIFFAQINRH